MVRWYHAIFTAYGFWLPNDPRGSWSTLVASWELYKFGGPATTTGVRRSVAGAAHDYDFRRQAKQTLKHSPVRFDELQRQSIASGIRQACDDIGIRVRAGAIGHDHAHVIVERHEKTIGDIIRRFKSRSSQHLNRDGRAPILDHTPWAEGHWAVYINDEVQLQAAIEYVSRHPMKEGLAPQHWPFIIPV